MITNTDLSSGLNLQDSNRSIHNSEYDHHLFKETAAKKTLWDKNESVRNCAIKVESYLSKCIESEDTHNIITNPEIFLAACCREAGIPYLQTIFRESLDGFVADVEKVRCMLENLYSRKIYGVYFIRGENGACYLRELPNPMMLFDVVKNKRSAIDNYKEILPVISNTVFEKSCEKFRVYRKAGRIPKKQNVGVLEFRWKKVHKPSDSDFEDRPNFKFIKCLREKGFFCEVISKDQKILKIHAKLIPEIAEDNSLGKYTGHTLHAFFESLFLSPDEFYDKYSKKKIPIVELLDIAHEYDHSILKENCRKMLLESESLQDVKKIQITHSVKNCSLQPPSDNLEDTDPNKITLHFPKFRISISIDEINIKVPYKEILKLSKAVTTKDTMQMIFEEYSDKTLSAVFKSLYLKPEKFRSKHMKEKIHSIEFLETVCDYDRIILNENLHFAMADENHINLLYKVKDLQKDLSTLSTNNIMNNVQLIEHYYTVKLSIPGYYQVVSKDHKIFGIHSNLLPPLVDFNEAKQIVTFKKYKAEILNIFFESLCLTPKQLIKKHSNEKVSELSAIEHEFQAIYLAKTSQETNSNLTGINGINNETLNSSENQIDTNKEDLCILI